MTGTGHWRTVRQEQERAVTSVRRYIITEFHEDGSYERREFGPDQFDHAIALLEELQSSDPHAAYWGVAYDIG